MKKVLFMLPVLVALFVLSGCSKDDDITKQSETIESVSLNEKNIFINTGESINLEYSYSPNIQGVQINWSSSNLEIVSVTPSGTVQGLKAGEATITIEISYNGTKVTDKCNVVVSDIKITDISLSCESLELIEKQSDKIVATVFPANATDKELVWTSSDESVAKVEDGKVTGVSQGICTIIVSTKDNSVSASCGVKVENISKYLNMEQSHGDLYWDKYSSKYKCTFKSTITNSSLNGKVELTSFEAYVNGTLVQEEERQFIILNGQYIEQIFLQDPTLEQGESLDGYNGQLVDIKTDNPTTYKIKWNFVFNDSQYSIEKELPF